MVSAETYMLEALKQAQMAAERGEVPIGAVLVCQDQVIARRGNEKEARKGATHHAELLVIEEACQKLGRWRLTDCTLYVTLEPCLMCCGAILQARLLKLVFGARDPKAGAVVSLYQTLSDTRLNHRLEFESGVREADCAQLLSDFFKQRR